MACAACLTTCLIPCTTRLVSVWAAPQIGVTRRAVVVDLGQDENGEPCSAPLCMINPELLWQSDDESVYEEGCLSVPDFYAEITRPASCRVGYLDKSGARQELRADGLLATCIQHELDHLNGVLFLDHLSTLKRNMILRKLSRGKSSKEPDL